MYKSLYFYHILKHKEQDLPSPHKWCLARNLKRLFPASQKTSLLSSCGQVPFHYRTLKKQSARKT